MALVPIDDVELSQPAHRFPTDNSKLHRKIKHVKSFLNYLI